MANIKIAPDLLSEARKLGNHRTDAEAITAALEWYVRLKNQLRIFELAGAVDFDPAYDYKADRRRDAKQHQ
jgi:hypothetical protein